MSISNFPVSLQPIIQQGFLDHQFMQALRSRLGYRAVADREPFPTGIGETITKTRFGLLPAATTPLNVSAINPLSGTAAKLDSGLTPQVQSVEQYTISLFEYGGTMDLNVKTSQVGIANRFVQNAYSLGEQAARTMDELARNALYAAYQGGNTFLRTAAASGATTIAVDDVRGFLMVPVNGVQQVVSGSYTLPAVINTGSGMMPVVVSGVAADATNVSITFGGFSGVLTLVTGLSAAAAAGLAVSSTIAPSILRPNARTTYGGLLATDTLAMSNILDAVALLRSNNVPTVNGLYNAYVDPQSARQLFADPDFKQLFQGAQLESVFASGSIEQPFLGVRFMMTTEAPVQVHPTLATRIHRPIVVGMGALIEGDFAGLNNGEPDGADAMGPTTVVDGVRMVTRPPLDRLQQIVTQSWNWDGGFTAPTDVTTTPATLPTATNAALKRAVIIEHVGA